MKLAYPLTLAAVLMLLSPPALAGNGAHPRTPVDWSSAPCMTIIDRSQNPIYPLEYDIPYEDTDVTPDEVTNSRTHQFFTFCRDRHLEDILPGWITEVDLQAAGDKGLGDPGLVDTELEVLENAPDWAGCWARITGDDERRPITFAAAAEPIMWDTSALPAGTWVVEGYTYEPWFNMWTPHPGVFKIVDDPDPAASPPAAALTFAEQTVAWGDEASITGCVDAMPGTTMSLSWSNGNINGEPSWQVFAEDIPAELGSFDLPFVPPIEAASNSVMIKLDIVDPMNRSWTAYSLAYIAVVDQSGSDTGCDGDGGFVSDPCDTGTGGSGESGSGEGGPNPDTGGSESGPSLDAGESGGGCSCSSAGPGSPVWGLAALAFVVGWVRRREDRAISSRRAG
jgi:MYXO-CTERM domain-containing protein